eukprot:UN29055
MSNNDSKDSVSGNLEFYIVTVCITCSVVLICFTAMNNDSDEAIELPNDVWEGQERRNRKRRRERTDESEDLSSSIEKYNLHDIIDHDIIDHDMPIDDIIAPPAIADSLPAIVNEPGNEENKGESLSTSPPLVKRFVDHGREQDRKKQKLNNDRPSAFTLEQQHRLQHPYGNNLSSESFCNIDHVKCEYRRNK